MDLSLVYRLTSLPEIHKLNAEVLAKERGIDSELDQVLGRRSELEQTFLQHKAPVTEASGIVLSSALQHREPFF
jgi:hypothetical protein